MEHLQDTSALTVFLKQQAQSTKIPSTYSEKARIAVESEPLNDVRCHSETEWKHVSRACAKWKDGFGEAVSE